MAVVAIPALDHAGVSASDVDAIFVGVLQQRVLASDFQAALVAWEPLSFVQCQPRDTKMRGATGSALSTPPWISSKPPWTHRTDCRRGKMTALPPGTLAISCCRGVTGKKKRRPRPDLPASSRRSPRATFVGRGQVRRARGTSPQRPRNALDNPYAHMRTDLGFDFCNKVSERNRWLPLRCGVPTVRRCRRSGCAGHRR